MKEVETSSFDYSNSISTTGSANYYAITTAADVSTSCPQITYGPVPAGFSLESGGKYSVIEIANWFLSKSDMTHKKLQKLCYYAQAWNYAIKGFRLIDTDFQAWIHGPVSPILYEKFKGFGYDVIKLVNKNSTLICAEDIPLLEDVWETYGDLTGNALEALTHREFPWISARKGYLPDERCSVVISPESMVSFYKSIYIGSGE